MLTGPKDTIYNFIFQELKVDKYDSTAVIDPNFAHTQRFVLLDKNFNVGLYNGLDTISLAQMSKDIGLLMLEKKPTRSHCLLIRCKWECFCHYADYCNNRDKHFI